MSSDDKAPSSSFVFGPLEQVIAMLLVMSFASTPSLPYSLRPDTLLSPPVIMLVLVAYLGYHLLRRQEGARSRNAALAKAARSAAAKAAASSSSSSSSSKVLSSSDIRKQGMPSSSSSSGKRVGNPAPKQVSSSGRKDDPSSNSFKKNYFLTMQGPGRPALVPFQDGLRPKKGEAAGTMWWDNVPDDAADMMAQPVDPDQARALMKNPWALPMIQKDLELLKLEKKRREEEARYEKVGNILQSLLGFLLLAVDLRLGVVALVFFLWRHFTLQHAREQSTEKEDREQEKAALASAINDAQKAGADRMTLAALKEDLSKL